MNIVESAKCWANILLATFIKKQPALDAIWGAQTYRRTRILWYEIPVFSINVPLFNDLISCLLGNFLKIVSLIGVLKHKRNAPTCLLGNFLKIVSLSGVLEHKRNAPTNIQICRTFCDASLSVTRTQEDYRTAIACCLEQTTSIKKYFICWTEESSSGS